MNPLLPDSMLVTQAPTSTLEQIMLADGKLFVVLTVVLLIWFGLILLVHRTDRRLQSLEKTVERGSIEHP